MGPTGRSDQRDFPRAARQDPRGGGADLEAAPGLGAGRIIFVFLETAALGWGWGDSLTARQMPAISIDRKRHHRIRETGAIPIEIENGVDERMAQAFMQRFVAVGDVEALVEQGGSEILTAG